MKRLFQIIILFVNLLEAMFSQNFDLEFDRLLVEDGLPQSTVHSIIQDKYGFIWIGTEDGLARYDGYSFVVYRNDRKDSASLASNEIRAILQDDNGNLWVGTKNGLSVLSLLNNPHTGKMVEGFHNFFHIPDDSSSISNNDVRCIYQDKSGIIWIGTAQGLNKVTQNPEHHSKSINYKSISFSHSLADKSLQDVTSKTFISSITEDGNGNLWIGTMGKGIIVLNRQTQILETYKTNPDDPESIGSNFIIKLYTDQAGRIWLGSYGGGLNRFDYKTKKFFRYNNDPDNPRSISENKVYGLIDDADGSLWIGTFSGGLNKLISESNDFIHYKHNKLNPSSLSNDFVRCLLIDRSNNLWVGTNNGINKTDLKPQKFFTFRNDYWNPNSLSHNFVLSVFEEKDNTLWIGTNNGLDRYDPKTKTFSNYNISHNNPKSGDGFVYSIQQDEDLNLWLGTFGGGLFKCSREGKIINQYLHNPGDEKGIIDNRVGTLFQMKNGDLVVGTVVGVCVLQKNDGKFRRYIISREDSIKLSERSIHRLYEDRNGIFWVSTDKGLFRIDPSNGNCTDFLSDIDDPLTISNNSVTDICEDSRGNLWVGTEDGLNELDRKTNTFTVFTTSDGLPNNYITSLAADKEGNLWIATNRGISKLNSTPSGQRFRNYDANDGLQGSEFNINASFKNQSGEIYFGGTNGLTKFNPSEIIDNPNLPDIAIVSFFKLGKPELTFLQIRHTEFIELGSDENFFSFELAAFDYTNPRKNQYAYQLAGFDKDWVYISHRRFASYTNIDPGEYTFRVKAANNDGIWNETGTSVKLIVRPPFYLTWTAYMFYIILAGTLLYYIRWYELRKRKAKSEAMLREEKEKAKLIEAQLKAEKAELQAKAYESEKELEKQIIRSRIASDLHDEIGSNLSSITLLSSLLTERVKEGSEIKKQLADINLAAKTSAESIRDIIWFNNPTSDKLTNLFSRMKETANMMLGGINFQMHFPEINTSEKINPELKRNLYMIFKEALNNIIKHSSADNVVIRLDKTNELLTILIKDDGIGFNVENVKEGNGLRNLRNRSHQMNAHLVLKSTPGKGTLISMQVHIT